MALYTLGQNTNKTIKVYLHTTNIQIIIGGSPAGYYRITPSH